jgi:hypothetical protein
VLIPVAVPYYLIGTHKRWHKILAILLLMGYVAVVIALTVAGQVLGEWLVT